MNSNNVIFGMENTKKIAEEISKITNIKLSEAIETTFADGEVSYQSKTTVRNSDVFIVASTSKPVNDNIMKLLIFIDSLKRASAKSINVIFTYYGYARQDRKSKGRQPITAKLVANLLETAGVNKIIAVDLHNPSIQGFFDIPVDDLRGQYVLAETIKKYRNNFSIVSPDHGGAVRARVLSELISSDIEIAIIDKRRTGPNQSEVLGLIGNVENKNVVIIDDMIDTGGTILSAAKTLKEKGAKTVIISATHGLFSRGFDIFQNNQYVEKVIVTNSIYNDEITEEKYSKLQVVDLSPFLSKVLLNQIHSDSISEFYDEIKKKLKEMK